MYHVDSSGEIRNQIRRLFQRASQQGREEEFVRALKAIHARLERDPLTFGEPLYHLRTVRWAVRTAAIRPLSVIYRVSEDHPIVLLGQICLMGRG